MSERYSVCYPREYTVKDNRGKEETKTSFVRVGTAFELPNQPGFSLELHVPLMCRAGQRLVMFLDDADSGSEKQSARGRGRR